MQNENQLRSLTMYIRDKERTRGCRPFKPILSLLPIHSSHSFFLRAYKLDGCAFRDGIEFDSIFESNRKWIPWQGPFSTLNQGLIRTRNNEIGSIAKQEQQRDRGAKMTNGGNSARNVDTGRRLRRVDGTMTLVVGRERGWILINIYLIKFPRRRHCNSATGVVIYATQYAGDLLIETTRNSSSS